MTGNMLRSALVLPEDLLIMPGRRSARRVRRTAGRWRRGVRYHAAACASSPAS